MKDKIIKLLPEIKWIGNSKLQDCIVNTYEEALTIGGWQPDDMGKIPFTLLIPNCSISYLTHVQSVTNMCKEIYREFNNFYKSQRVFTINYDNLIAGALLHDVGKLVEYTRTIDGRIIKSELGKELRHPFSGTVLAMKNGISPSIAHIIANHAHEGDKIKRAPEAVIIHHIDMLNFESTMHFLE